MVREKEEEGVFASGKGVDEKIDFRKYKEKSLREVYLQDQGYCEWAVRQNPVTRKLKSLKYFFRCMVDITERNRM